MHLSITGITKLQIEDFQIAGSDQQNQKKSKGKSVFGTLSYKTESIFFLTTKRKFGPVYTRIVKKFERPKKWHLKMS